MSEIKLSKKMTGWFDVKVYSANTPRENWRMKADGDNISFGVTFDAKDPEADEYRQFGKEYTDAAGNKRLRVSFKISPKTKWFDAQAQPVAKPDNATLDGIRYECTVQYAVVLPDPKNDKSARGYWVRAIQYEPVNDNPFTAVSFGIAPNVPPVGVPTDTPEGIGDEMPLPF